MKLPWFIPQLRDVKYEDDVLEQENTQSSQVIIKEYRDEANRPWYKYFDEYEYRETTEESKKFKLWQWYPEGTSDAEKKLLMKLDLTLAFTTFLGYWMKYIDSSNLNNAYISGMKEDLGMGGNDLINVQVLFLVGNIIFELPWLFLLPRVSLTYYLFVFELLWSLFTMLTSQSQNVATLKAFRFLIGSFEAIYFPVAHYCQPLWYKSDEIGRRLGLMYIGQFLGVLVSGLIASGAIQLAPNGMKGYKFMFLLDGTISFVIAFITFFCHPGTPAKCYSIWLTDDEIRLARNRMKKAKVDVNPTVKSFFDKDTWKKIFTTWHFWLLGIMQMCGFNTNSASSGSFGLWLKSLHRYELVKINRLTAVPPALGILWIFIICFGADFTRKRFGMIFFSFIMNFVSNIILAIWEVPESAKWAGFLLAYFLWSQSSVFNPLISDLLRKDQNLKSIEWMIIYILGLQSSAWIGRLTFPTVDEPRYPKGFSSCAGFSIAFCLLLILAYHFYRVDERKAALENGIYLYNSKYEEIPEEATSHIEHIRLSDDLKKNTITTETEIPESQL